MTVIDRREILALVQQALVGNFLRNEAIAERLSETGAGEITMSGIDDGHHPQLIIRQIERAEALLSDIVRTHLLKEGDGESRMPDDLAEAMAPLRSAQLRDAVIERPLRRINASWSYVDLVAWEHLVSRADTPILFQLSRDLGKPDRKHQVIAEEHNLSGVHFHYARLDGTRSDRR